VDVEALRRQTQQRLIQFLKTDLELAHTFVELALEYLDRGNLEEYARLLGKTRRAIENVYRLEEKILDPNVREELECELEELENLLFSDDE
jgi:hypothetical protein